MTELNIVELIEHNPITKLSNTYNNKMLIKIKENFTDFEQQLFVSSFYCYLNYDKTADFVVDLDNIWKWLGFSQKIRAREILEKNFKLEFDYKTAFSIEKAVLNKETNKETNIKQNGGQNIKKIYLTIKCFKSLCLKAQTKKASEIHEYYLKLEDILQQVIEEETNELKLQLEEKENTILEIKQNAEVEKQQLTKNNQKAIEHAIIVQFPVNTECIYFGTIDNTNEVGEHLIKFGHTNDLSTRLIDHHKNYTNFCLVAAFRVQNKVEIENLVKIHPKIKKQIRSIEVKGKNKTEIIAYNDHIFTIEKLTKLIKDIIHSKTYSIDNFNKLLKQNDDLLNDNRELKLVTEEQKIEITKLYIQMEEMKEVIEKQRSSLESLSLENKSVYQNALLPEDELTQKFNKFINDMCIVRPDVEESSVDLEGQFRIWNKIKPQKEIFHAFKNYLDTRFKPSRLSKQDKNQVVYGYIGLKLKEIIYKKKFTSNDTETFIFQVCKFSPNGKILNSTLLDEYKRWKLSVNKEYSNNDMTDLKDYLNNCEYVLKATVWTDHGSNEGYYGLLLKSDEHKYKTTSSTGKTVQKIELETGNILGSWTTIAKAAEFEHISAAKMSRSIKNKIIFNDYFYQTT